ncbi:hypothetical protein QT351_08735 [Escherichia coli]|nr:hypothetical protein [Escherichia coli]
MVQTEYCQDYTQHKVVVLESLQCAGEGCTPDGWVSTEGRLSASTLTRVR